ncbi:unnamed protein product [Polarella glacialis]|uniref:TPM domain-containing protein n=2 Tax=Polarella glacialis TaxID=89957 RepID=A0A813DDG5_POLGL|nr:unnamed protein product [Polarella glacialis]
MDSPCCVVRTHTSVKPNLVPTFDQCCRPAPLGSPFRLSIEACHSKLRVRAVTCSALLGAVSALQLHRIRRSKYPHRHCSFASNDSARSLPALAATRGGRTQSPKGRRVPQVTHDKSFNWQGETRRARWRRRLTSAVLAVLVLVSASTGQSLREKGEWLQARNERKDQVEYVYRQETPFRTLRLAAVRAAVPGKVSSPGEVPSPRSRSDGGWVTDMTGVLDSSTVKQVNSMSRKVQQETGGEVVVITVPSVEGASGDRSKVKDFTTKLFNHWGIGERYKNNGVLILVSIGDRRVEVEIGKGLNGPFNEARWLRQTIDESIIPQLRQDRWNQGVLAGVTAVCAKLVETDSQLSTVSWFKTMSALCWGASVTSAIAAVAVLAKPIFDLTPRCSLCRKRTSKLRDASISELQPGQQAEAAVGSVRHVLCGCCRPTCRKTWALLADPQPQKEDPTPGGQRIGGKIPRSREVRLEPEEVIEAVRDQRGLALLSEARWLSRYKPCRSCSYRTALIVTETTVLATTYSPGLRIQVTDCCYCGANNIEEILLPVMSSSSDSGGGGSSDGGGGGGDF